MSPTSKLTDEMRSYTLLTAGNPFEELMASVRFEDAGKGRQGAVLVNPDATGNIPIVRTTTRYITPAQCWRSIHDRLARQIEQTASLSVGFNNALIENYTNAYTTMGSHSDQALDLAADSSIAIFSCYKHPDLANPPRKLIVELKDSDSEPIEIPLTHNSAIVFSVNTNRRFKHKIVLEKFDRMPENRWLGITFRTSETLVRFHGDRAYFPDGVSLTLATEAQQREFYDLRRRENNEPDLTYPRIAYTVSESDLVPPTPVEDDGWMNLK